MKKYKHLVFDVDGTLLNSVQVVLGSMQRALVDLLGKEFSVDELKFAFGMPGIRSLGILGVEDPEKNIEVWMKYYDQFEDEIGSPFYEGMKEVLEILVEKGISLGVVTSKMREETRLTFQKYQMNPYFSCCVTSDDTPRGKPFPDPLLRYMELTGAKREEILYFGDTDYDMQCAKDAGIDRVLVLWGCMNPEGIESTYRLEKPEEILQFV